MDTSRSIVYIFINSFYEDVDDRCNVVDSAPIDMGAKSPKSVSGGYD
jgi:hypothetical protein